MKLRNYFGLTVISATLALLYSSCRDQDFDWEDHYRENVEYQYQEIIKSIFGEISPDQSWDFSGFSAADTVAEENVGGTRTVPTGCTSIKQIDTTDGKKDIYYSDNDWYQVPPALINWFKSELPEKNERGTNPSKGQTFVLKVPEHGFKITPLYTGQSLSWKLGIQQVDANMQPTGTAYEIWSKGQRMQRKVNNGSWQSCGEFTRTDESSVSAIRSKTIEIEDGFFTPSSTVMLYLEITRNRIWSEAPRVIDPTKARNDQPTTPVGQKLWSNRQMIALGVPENLISGRQTITVGGNILKNDVIIVGCEDNNVPDNWAGSYVNRTGIEYLDGDNGDPVNVGGNPSSKSIKLEKSDWDYNDLVLMIEGYGLKTIPIKYREYTSKRYMVEDLGYDSQKKINRTDIDFNDIVVDIVDKSSGVEYEKDLNGRIIESSKKPFTDSNGKTEVTVWALGGVFDFTLYTYTGTNPSNNRKQVFKKSQTSAGDFNSYYVVDGKNITGLTTTTMYNTSRTWPNCDGNFDGNNYIWRKEFNKSDISWDSQKNNLVFVVADNYIHKDYTSTPVQETTITFPAKGDTHPQIIAFPIGTMWNEEREGIDQRWPLGGTFPNK